MEHGMRIHIMFDAIKFDAILDKVLMDCLQGLASSAGTEPRCPLIYLTRDSFLIRIGF
jgi:hypothetical protein